MKKINVTCYTKGGLQTIVEIMYEKGDEDSDIASKAKIELNRQGIGFNSDRIRYEWNDEDLVFES